VKTVLKRICLQGAAGMLGGTMELVRGYFTRCSIKPFVANHMKAILFSTSTYVGINNVFLVKCSKMIIIYGWIE